MLLSHEILHIVEVDTVSLMENNTLNNTLTSGTDTFNCVLIPLNQFLDLGLDKKSDDLDQQ